MVIQINNKPSALNCTPSKGNQFKWKADDIWYKEDYLGYEALAEYIVSRMLEKSNLKSDEYVSYRLGIIDYDDKKHVVSISDNFLKPNCNLFTLQRLYQQQMGENLYKKVFQIENIEERTSYLVNQIEQITGLSDFGVYLSKLLTIDALFLNEDRHYHNIAIIYDNSDHYSLCPVFDNGSCLLSDTTLDYPLEKDAYELIGKSKPKTTSFFSFDEQLDAVEKLYGQNIRFDFDKKYIDEIIDEIDDELYDSTIKKRVRTILVNQFDKYRYLFK